jgi:hypothetical protein
MGSGRATGEEGEAPREDKAQEGLDLGSGLNRQVADTDARREQSPEVGLVVELVVSLYGGHGRSNHSQLVGVAAVAEEAGETAGEPQEGRGVRESVRLCEWRQTLKGETPWAGPA